MAGDAPSPAATAEPPSTAGWFLGPGHAADHLDEAADYTIHPAQLLRLLTRRLFGYHAAPDRDGSPFVPVADLAGEVPTVANGGLSADGLTCRLTVRPGVVWDAQFPREVTAHDVVRGLKRVAHPMPPEVRRYFTDTIAGMREYCEAYRSWFDGEPPTGPDVAQFHMRHRIEGVTALDPHTLVICLLRPANDLTHLLATAAAAAAPREYDYYLPGSYELMRNAPSAGPYRVAAPYRIARGLERNRELVLEPNPRWQPDSGGVHRRPGEVIRITADAPRWSDGHRPPTPAWRLTAGRQQVELGWTAGPYLAVNLRQSRDRPTLDVSVRRALSYALDRAAVRDLLAELPGMNCVVHHGLLPPGSPGSGVADAFGSAGEHGDPVRARGMLADAGHPMGIRLRLAVPDRTLERRVADVLAAGAARAGIALVPEVVPPGRYGEMLRDAADRWDLALASRLPDWFGNNGRSIVGPLLRGGAEPGGANHGQYHNPALERLWTRALAEPDEFRAVALWQQVDLAIVQDLPIIPVVAHGCGPCFAAADAAPTLAWMAT